MADLIDRRAAIKAVKEMCEHYTPNWSTVYPHIDFVVNELEDLPSVEPHDSRQVSGVRIDKDGVEVLFSERKHGTWIETFEENIDGTKTRVWQCSECESIELQKRNYCPNCGVSTREDKP